MLRYLRNPWLASIAVVIGLLAAGALLRLTGRLYVAACTPDWIAQLRDSNPDTRRHAALFLNEFAAPTEDVLQAFMTALQDEYVGVRQQAAHGLGKFGPAAREAIPLLLEALNDEDEFVRFHAAGSLRRIGHDPMIDTN